MICTDAGECELAPPSDTYMAWLMIEIYCFYTYLVSAIFYICFHQLVEGICMYKESSKSDMRKTITDFISYTSSNLTWFAINWVLIAMPVICIVNLDQKSIILDRSNADMSYKILLVCVCICNVFQFCLRPRIYTVERKQRLYGDEPEKTTEVSDANVDAYENLTHVRASSTLPLKTGGMLGTLGAAITKNQSVDDGLF